MMSPVRLRTKTVRVLTDRIKKFGDDHPATFAAYQRAHLAWDRLWFTPPLYSNDAELRKKQQVALSRAYERAYGKPGWHNRHQRRRYARG